MALTGDFARLTDLRRALASIANGDARKRLLVAMADEAHKQTIACFAEKRDPYGRQWPKRKAPNTVFALRHSALQSSHPLLDKSGALIASVRSRATDRGIKVSMLGYGVYHWQPDRPGVKLPQRAMLPTRRQGMGPIWGEAFLRVASRVRKQLMGFA